MKCLLIAMMIFTASLSQAKVQCTVSAAPSVKEGDYTQPLWAGEAVKSLYLVVNKTTFSVQEVDVTQFTSFEQWKKINGSAIVILNPQENNQYMMAVGHVDASRGQTNALPMDAIAFGKLNDQQFLALMVPSQNLAVTCAILK